MIESKKFSQLINKQIEDISQFIVDNYNNLDIYFFIGAGFLKYLSNEDNKKIIKNTYLTWNEMIKNKSYPHLNITNFNDLLTIPYDYEFFINKINTLNEEKFDNEIKNNKNDGLFNLFRTLKDIFVLNSNINDNKNNIKIITTNHCNTINHYFKIDECYDLEQIERFLKSNYCILNLHKWNKKIFHTIDDYISMYTGKEKYINKLLKLPDNINKKNKDKTKLIIIFGSRMEELHIITFINKLRFGSNQNYVLWIRDIGSLLEEKCDEKKYDYINDELNKILNEYKNKNYKILFYPKEEYNVLFNLISKKVEILFEDNKNISLSEKFVLLHPNYNKPIDQYKIEWIINEYSSQKETTDYDLILSNLKRKKDYESIFYILAYSKDSLKEFEWYFKNCIENEEQIEIGRLLNLICCCYDFNLNDESLKDVPLFPKFLFSTEILLLIWNKIIKRIKKYKDYFKAYMFLFENIDKSKINNEQLKYFINYLFEVNNSDVLFNNFEYKKRISNSNNFKKNIEKIVNEILTINEQKILFEQQKKQIQYKLNYLLYYLPNSFNLNNTKYKVKYMKSAFKSFRIIKIDESKINEKISKISDSIKNNINGSLLLIKNLYKDFRDHNFNYSFYGKISALFYNIVKLFINNDIDENNFIKLSKAINNLINKCNKLNDDKIDFYYSINNDILNLNLYKIINIIKILNSINCKFLTNQIFIMFTFNATLNPTFDFYKTNYFSLIDLIYEMNKIEEIKLKPFLETIFKNISSNKYIDIYCKVVNRNYESEFQKFLWILFDLQNKVYKFENYSIFVTKDFLKKCLTDLNEIYMDDSRICDINMCLFFVLLALDAFGQKIIDFDFLINDLLFENKFIDIYKKYNLHHMLKWIKLSIDKSKNRGIKRTFNSNFLEKYKDLFKKWDGDEESYFKYLNSVQRYFDNKLILNKDIKDELSSFWTNNVLNKDIDYLSYDLIKNYLINEWIQITIYICSFYEIKRNDSQWNEKINNFLYKVQNKFELQYIKEKTNELFNEMLEELKNSMNNI